MFVARINFDVINSDDPEAQHDELQWLWGTYRMDGHTLGRESPLVQYPEQLTIYTLIPAEDAFEPVTFNTYIEGRLRKLDAVGLSNPTYCILGNDPSAPLACDCRESPAFILFTTYLALQSPLHCAECFAPIPLYRLPRFSSGDFHEIISWQSDYRSCDSLQMNCSTGERFATRELSEYDSSLSRRGRSICEEVRRLIGKPAYYYLYRDSRKNHEAELKRVCPHCGGKWLLKERWHGLFDFRCDRCLLVSNIAWNVRPS